MKNDAIENKQINNNEKVNERVVMMATRTRCRIPQRMTPSPARQGHSPPKKPTSSQGGMPIPKPTPRPRSESCSRSSNRSDSMSVKQLHAPRTSRPEIFPTPLMKVSSRCFPHRQTEQSVNVRKPSKRMKNSMAALGLQSPPTAKSADQKNPLYKKTFSAAKRLPNSQKLNKSYRAGADPLPDQETIRKREDIELKNGYKEAKGSKVATVADLRKSNHLAAPPQEVHSEAQEVKSNWTRDITQFETLKRELLQQQREIMELYAELKNTHKMMSSLGQKVNMPAFDDLQMMNVGKLTPDQLLQLCAVGNVPPENTPPPQQQQFMTIDLNKFVEMPSKLVATCELTLNKRKEVIDWFQTLKSEEKGISITKLTKKINEFNAENEMLASSINTCKSEFLKELGTLLDHMRKGMNEAVTLQVRIEELMYEISELNALNGDLRKQMQAVEHMKSPHNKHRIEELEKELKEEKCKKTVIKDRLTRAEGQVKIGNERALQLESTLEQSRAQNWTLERTIQQLNDQNHKLQTDFDKELCKLTASIKDNTTHLEEIAEAREKLQAEKESLEKRLQELSDNYNESLSKMKEELITNVAKLTVTEKKFEEETEERKNLESKLADLCSQLLESELRYKDMLKEMKEKDDKLSKLSILECEIGVTNNKLEAANRELTNYKNRFQKQNQTIQEIEQNYREAVNIEQSLKLELVKKQNYIAELENNRSLLEQKLQESENKMEMYEKQLNTLRDEIAQVHEKFGEFDNMDELREMIKDQRDKLIETTRQNGDLATALQQKDLELENHLEQIAEQQQILDQKDDVIKMLTQKEEEQLNIIKLLRSNMEMRVKSDCELKQQLSEKNAEIDSLLKHLETTKQQISQLEQIILTLEEQLRKVYLQRKRDQDKLTMLEKAITDYEVLPEEKDGNEPADNLDNLIKILESELGASFDPLIQNKNLKKKKYVNRNNYNQIDQKCNRKEQGEGKVDNITSTLEYKDSSGFIQRNTKQKSCDTENLGRKQAITNIGTKLFPNSQPIDIYKSSADKKAMKVVQVMNDRQDERKCRMLKLAVHNF